MKLIIIIFITLSLFTYGQERTDSLKLSADSLFELRKYKDAISVYLIYIKNDTTNHEVYFKLANAYGLINENDKALIYANKSISLNQSDSRVYCLRGVLYGFFNLNEKCYSDLNRAISLNAKNDLALFYRGQFRLSEEEFKLAKEDFDNAITIITKGEYIFYRGYAQVGLKLFDKACDDFKEALKLGVLEAENIIKENCE